MYIAYIHYSKQTDKVKPVGFPLPLLGNIIQILFSENTENKHPFVKLMEQYFGGNKFNKCALIFACQEPMIIIQDVKVLEQLYTTQNMYFDKHPMF